jgi:hypothetical protein
MSVSFPKVAGPQSILTCFEPCQLPLANRHHTFPRNQSKGGSRQRLLLISSNPAESKRVRESSEKQ